MGYEFRSALAQAGLSAGAVQLIEDFMDYDGAWRHRDRVIRALILGAPWKTKGDMLDGYLSFQCRLTEANSVLPHFGYFIERGTEVPENYRLVSIVGKAA